MSDPRELTLYVVAIRETDKSLNLIGPFWHENAALAFSADLATHEIESEVIPVTDRDKWLQIV